MNFTVGDAKLLNTTRFVQDDDVNYYKPMLFMILRTN